MNEEVKHALQYQEVYSLSKIMNNIVDECKDLTVPSKYGYQFGIDKSSSLARLLESYHQLRLKDKQ